jgi:hypothetical protein
VGFIVKGIVHKGYTQQSKQKATPARVKLSAITEALDFSVGMP